MPPLPNLPPADDGPETDRLARLQRVTAALSGALTPEEVAEVAVAQGTGALGARAGSLGLLEGDGVTVRIVRHVGYPENVVTPYLTFPLAAPIPVSEAIRTGEPVYLCERADWERRYPDDQRGPGTLQEDAAWAAVPLLFGGRAIGAIGLSFADTQRFDIEERAFMATLAEQCAQAMERARLYAEAETARREAEAAGRRMAFLAEASVALSTSLDYHAMLATLARTAVPRIADWCAVDMLAADGRGIERLAVAHVDPDKVRWAHDLADRYPSAYDDPTGVGKVLRTGERDYFPLIDDAFLVAAIPDDPERLAVAREIGFASYLCVPLAARGRTLGALTFVTTDESGRHLSAADVTLAEELARRSAVAVDNARLYRAAQESEERLSGIIGSAMDAIVTVDGDGRILVFNGAAERMFRCAAKDALGTRATRFFPEALAGEEGASPAPPVVPAAPRVITARRDDGTEFAAEATVSRAEAGGQPLYTAIVRDLADRQRAEAAERALKEQEGRQRLFLREILSSVTEGKLRLCDTAADLPAPLPEASPAIGLTRETMRGLRAAAAEVAAAEGLPEQRTQDLLTAVGEAGMNAVRHGGGGTGRVRAMDGRVQVWVEDRGKGIDLDRLPRAVAERGYTTGGGFGHGFYLMLQTCDAVYLLTGPDGTTVVLEQGREAPAPAWLLGHNAATDW